MRDPTAPLYALRMATLGLSIAATSGCTLLPSEDDDDAGEAATTDDPVSESTGTTGTATGSSDDGSSGASVDASSGSSSSGEVADTGAGTTSCDEADGPVVVWLQDFEDGPGDWSVEGAVWEIGEPTALDGPQAFAGEAVAGTVLAGDYPSGMQSARLVSPQIDVPADVPARVRLLRWTDFGYGDQGLVQVRVDGGAWIDVEETLVLGRTGGWAQAIVDLDAFAGETVQLAFWFTANSGYNVGPGWFLDDVSLEHCALTPFSSSSFDDGAGDWSALGPLWAIGEPTAPGGPAAHGGTHVIGTTLDGEYESGAYESLLVSPLVHIDPAAANPRLRVQHWHDFGYGDGGAVLVRVVGQDWLELEELFVQDASDWIQTDVPLGDYAGQDVQVGFEVRTNSGYAVGLGWYLDDVEYLPD